MTAPVQEGEVLAEKYRVDKVLGVGGMGVVVAAHHIHLDEKVAIKFLLPAALASRDTVARFAREARAAVRIKSEHVARVSDVGTLQNGAPYMVMEYLEGADLGAWLRQRGKLSVAQAVEFLLQACEAIAEAHALGIVHRDLKPANLYVVRRADGLDSIKVLDFGISKVTNKGNPLGEMTNTAVVMGSPLYMSPEQMQSAKDVDARSDIWALGVILYELLAGEAPFVADTMPELVVKVMDANPPPLSSRRPDTPVEVERVIRKCLDRDRAKRFPNVADLAAALVEFGPARCKTSVERITRVIHNAGLSSTAPATPAQPPAAEAQSDETLTQFGKTSAKPASSSNKRLAVAAAAVIAIATLAVTALRGRSSPPESGTAGVPDPANAHPVAVAPTTTPSPTPAAAPEVAPVAPSAAASADTSIVATPSKSATPASTPRSKGTTAKQVPLVQKAVAAPVPSAAAKPGAASLGGRM